MPDKTYTIKNAEIFAAGIHNGDTYTKDDLDVMVKAAKTVGFTPPLKEGHTEDPGAPALGWLENVRRVGNKLLADITKVPQAVYDSIKSGRYDRISAEVYGGYKDPNLKQDWRYVLRAAALLGADIPAVKSLQPLRETLAASASFAACFASPGISIRIDSVEDDEENCPCQKDNGCCCQNPDCTCIADKCDCCTDGEECCCIAKAKGQDMSKMSSHKHHKHFNSSGKGQEDGNKSVTKQSVGAQSKFKEVTVMDERMKELEEKFSKLEALHSATLKDKDGEIAKLSDELKKLKEAGAPGKGTDSEDVLALRKRLDDVKLELAATEEKFAEESRKAKALAESQRKERILKKASVLKAPALRPYVEALYTLASEEANTKHVIKFSESRNGKQVDREIPYEAVVDELVSRVNGMINGKLFSDSASAAFTRDIGTDTSDPRLELDKRVKAYCAEKGLDATKKYSEVMKIVLNSDAELKAAYAGQS